MERCCTTAQLRVASLAGIPPAEMRPVVTQMHTDLHEFNMSQPRATQHCEPLQDDPRFLPHDTFPPDCLCRCFGVLSQHESKLEPDSQLFCSKSA